MTKTLIISSAFRESRRIFEAIVGRDKGELESVIRMADELRALYKSGHKLIAVPFAHAGDVLKTLEPLT